MPGQVTFDAKGSFSGTSATPTWAHVCSGAKVLYVAATPSLNNAVSGVTYAGKALTVVETQTTSNPRAELWKLENPPQGGHQVVVTQASSVCGIWGSFSIRNVDIIAGEYGLTKGSGEASSGSFNVVNVPVGGMAFDLWTIRNQASWSGGSGQTMINRLTQGCGVTHGHWNSYEAGSGTIAMDAAWGNSTVHGWIGFGLGPGEPAGNQVMIIA